MLLSPDPDCQSGIPVQKVKFIKETVKLPSYLDDENNPLTLSQVFADPDGAKQIFFGGITRNLALVSWTRKALIKWLPTSVSWIYFNGNSNMKAKFHSFHFQPRLKGDDTSSSLFPCLNSMMIDSERLLPDDLASTNPIEERHRR